MQLNKALVGFLTHSGYTHGGNGYEGIAFLLDQFRDSGPRRSHRPEARHRSRGARARVRRGVRALQGEEEDVRQPRHPEDSGRQPSGVQGPPVNHDPREVYVRELFRKRGEYNVFHEYYHALVQALFDAGVSRNVYCVNIDAVIAALLLKILWQPYRSGAYPEQALETAAFTIFLYPRMLGCASEIDDHMNRGRNMDTRTPASQCRFVT